MHQRKAICQKLFNVAQPKDCKKWDWLQLAIKCCLLVSIIVFSGRSKATGSFPTLHWIFLVLHFLMPAKPIGWMSRQTGTRSFYPTNVFEFFRGLQQPGKHGYASIHLSLPNPFHA